MCVGGIPPVGVLQSNGGKSRRFWTGSIFSYGLVSNSPLLRIHFKGFTYSQKDVLSDMTVIMNNNLRELRNGLDSLVLICNILTLHNHEVLLLRPYRILVLGVLVYSIQHSLIVSSNEM